MSTFCICTVCSKFVPSTSSSTASPIEAPNTDEICFVCMGILQPGTSFFQPILDTLNGTSYSSPTCCISLELPAALIIRSALIGLDSKILKAALKNAIESELILPLGKTPAPTSPLSLNLELHTPLTDSHLSFLPKFGVRVQPARWKQLPRAAPRFSTNQLLHAMEHNAAFKSHLLGSSAQLLAALAGVQELPSPCVSLAHVPVFVAGRYLKLARGVSQTEWSVNGKKLAPFSVAELICPHISDAFRALGDPTGTRWNFLGSGREDADVRMLGSGRPFIVEILNPQLTAFPETGFSPVGLEQKINAASHFPDDAEALALTEGDAGLPLVQVMSLQLVTHAQRKAFTSDDGEVRKTYACMVWVAREITQADLDLIQQTPPFSVQQHTPLRVLHRRAAGFRMKQIYAMSATLFDPHHLILTISTEGGTYIKEFIHGDHGRTVPSFGTLLQSQTEILTLDVLDVHVDFPPSIV